jgi:2-phosphosulfolactate phosphatase
VFRAFTVSALALDAGADACLLVREVEDAIALRALIPGSLVSAEIGGTPIAGIPLSNSPSQILEADLSGRVLIQRTSAGTQGVAACRSETILACSLLVAKATARRIVQLRPDAVTLVAMGEPAGHLEDGACAEYIKSLVEGGEPDLDRLLAPLRQTERYRQIDAGEVPWFPSRDLGLALQADRFDFTMPATPTDIDGRAAFRVVAQ